MCQWETHINLLYLDTTWIMLIFAHLRFFHLFSQYHLYKMKVMLSLRYFKFLQGCIDASSQLAMTGKFTLTCIVFTFLELFSNWIYSSLTGFKQHWWLICPCTLQSLIQNLFHKKKVSSYGNSELPRLSRIPFCKENGQSIKELPFRTLSTILTENG